MSKTINQKEAEFDFSEAADIIYDKLFMFHGDEFDYEEGLKAINACTWVLNGMMRQMIKEHDTQAKKNCSNCEHWFEEHKLCQYSIGDKHYWCRLRNWKPKEEKENDRRQNC